MKKFILLTAGLFLISESVIPISEASRNVYHMYLRSRVAPAKEVKIGKKRHFSKRRYGFSVKRSAQMFARSQDIAPAFAFESSEAVPSTISTTPNWKERVRKVRRPRFDAKDMNVMETYENNRFSISIPKGWQPRDVDEVAEAHLFKNPLYKGYKVSVKYLDDDCHGGGFTACAIDISKSENRHHNSSRLFPTSKMERQARGRNTVLNSSEKTATLTETFYATTNGDNEYMISRHFVQEPEGGVFMIETQTDSHLANQFVFISKRIFDSFRIFQDFEESY